MFKRLYNGNLHNEYVISKVGHSIDNLDIVYNT